MNKSEKTLVIGASENPERYSNKAANRLMEKGYKVKLIGNKIGRIGTENIQTGMPNFKNINTVTLYLGPQNQPSFYDYIINLKPKRVIFNPGTENEEFYKKLKDANIIAEEACTLVLLSLNSY